MHAEETKIYYALLIGIVTLVVLIVYFLIMIFRHHTQIKAVRLERYGEDIDALEKDRERIAFELHDDFASSLGTLRMEVARLISPGEKNYDKLPGIKKEIDSMVERMKDMAHEMMPRELTRRGLSKALELLVARIETSSGIIIQYTNDLSELDRKKSLHIYRIIQEVLNNVLKHADASFVELSLWRSGGKIHFIILDDGKGFDVKEQCARGNGAGLYNISARMQLMQGGMYITSEPNGGTIYEFEIPDK
jgi:signal transduction histidine kinase